MADTSAIEAMLVLFGALAPEEQEEAFQQISDARLQRIAGDESEMARMTASLQRVARHVGTELTPDLYRAGYRELRDNGVDVIEISKLIRHFTTWRRAKEALALSETTTPRRIEARFRSRRVGKIWRYSEQTLGDTLRACVEHYGRVPMVAEFDWWRERELQLAAATGNDAFHIPSATPYRRRWKTWTMRSSTSAIRPTPSGSVTNSRSLHDKSPDTARPAENEKPVPKSVRG